MDHRQPCRYGVQCYQKNIMHREKFKHPDESENKENTEANKKRPLSSSDSEADLKKAKTVATTETDDATTTETDKAEMDETPTTETDEVATTETDDTEDEAKAEEDGVFEDSTDTGAESKETEEKVVYTDILPESPEDINESIKQKFLVSMPEDFYQFFKFCEGLNKEDPTAALSSAGLKLCGPYDVLAGKISKKSARSASLFLRHYRYYYDPPEFQTVITSTEPDAKLFHIGYFRDSPEEAPVFVASNCAAVDGKIVPLADNIFGAVYQHLAKRMSECDPFTRTRLCSVQEKIKLFANRMIINGDANEISLEAKTPGMKLRDRKKVSTTFHGAGLVVPYDKKTEVGYREIPETTASLKKIFKNVLEAETEDEKNKALDVLQELVTNVQFANDEGDPGMGMELGLNAFAYGGEALHNTIRHLLGVGYELLDRDPFGAILTAHLDHRVKGDNVDMFN